MSAVSLRPGSDVAFRVDSLEEFILGPRALAWLSPLAIKLLNFVNPFGALHARDSCTQDVARIGLDRLTLYRITGLQRCWVCSIRMAPSQSRVVTSIRACGGIITYQETTRAILRVAPPFQSSRQYLTAPYALGCRGKAPGCSSRGYAFFLWASNAC